MAKFLGALIKGFPLTISVIIIGFACVQVSSQTIFSAQSENTRSFLPRDVFASGDLY